MNIDKIMYKYELAYKKIKNIFDFIYNEYSEQNDVNPIEHIKYRIKKSSSIEEKLIRRGYPVTEDSVDKYLSDIVGVRVVCSFLSDLEFIKNVIRELEEKNVFKIVKEKDYVSNPKESGYSSYHIIVSVPINYNNEISYVNVEIQIRTIAMDMSASLEHKVCYKKQDYSENLKNMLRRVTTFCTKLDQDLDIIVNSKKNINNNQNDILKNIYPFMQGSEFRLNRLKYESGLKFVRDEFLELYNRKYIGEDGVNPIEHIKSRIKHDDEIVRKLIGKDKRITIENIYKYVNDYAGIRIVCSFLSDIEIIKDVIRELNDNCFLEIINEKDYVKYPKESGYRGYHLLVKVPVYSLAGKEFVKVEIQIRTVAMEMWASLEEKIGYHNKAPREVVEELYRSAVMLSLFDEQVDNIYSESRKEKNTGYVKKKIKV